MDKRASDYEVYLSPKPARMKEPSNSCKQIDTLNEKSWERRYSNTSEALELALKAETLSKTMEYEKGMAYAGLNRSVCSFLMSKNEEGILEKLRISHRYFLAQNDQVGLVRALNGLGNLYDSYGEYEKGLTYCLEGLKHAERIDYKEGLGDLLSTCGNIYSRLLDYSHALESYQKSLVIRESIQELKAAASSLNLIARTYTSLGDFDNGLLYYNKSIELRERLNDTGALPWNYLGLASLYEKKGEPERALLYYSKSRALNQKSKDRRLDLHCLIGIGRYLLLLRDTTRGISELEEALGIASSLNAKPLLYEIHFLLASAYELSKNMELALLHFRKFHTLKEEVLNMELGNRLKNQQISFAVEHSEQEAEIYRLRNVELKSAYEEIEEKNKDITSSINYASLIQQAILPDPCMIREHFPESFILFNPKDIVSGDFYWFGKTAGSNYIAAADCTGHGVPGAMMSMLGIEKLNESLLHSDQVSEMLSYLNRSIKRSLGQSGKAGESRDGMDIALLCLRKAGDQFKMNYAAANRPLLIIRKESDEITEIKATKVAIGGFTEDDQVFASHEFTLNKGDTVYVFSDGYADQFGMGGKKLKTSKFKEILLSIQDRDLDSQKTILDSFIKEWKEGQEQTDDILVMGIRV